MKTLKNSNLLRYEKGKINLLQELFHFWTTKRYMSTNVTYPKYISVAELPKSYGPHVHIIVLQTSDNSTCKTNNFGSLSGVLGEPRIIHFFLSSGINYRNIVVLQKLYNYIIDYIRVNSGTYNHKFTIIR
jgi:hypothetical protein